MRRLIFAAVAGLICLFPATLRAQSSESRYNKEFVFPQSMRNLSLGVSPTILREFMIHVHEDNRLSVTLPPVHFAVEKCAWDMGNAGSVGWGVSLSYGRYKYSYAGNNGRGGDVINVSAGMTQALVGPSYHYTIHTRFEAYAYVMFGAGITGFRNDTAGLKHDWASQFIWNGVAGMRYFFSNSCGVYAEGGYTSGCVNAGITYRW